MAKAPAYQWYPGDWKRDPGVGALTPEARSFWREAIDALWESETHCSFTATVQGWAALTRVPAVWVKMFIAENKVLSVCDVTLSHSYVTLKSRRMERQEIEREQARIRKRRERGHGDVTPESRNCHNAPSSSSSSSTSKKEKSAHTREPEPDPEWEAQKRRALASIGKPIPQEIINEAADETVNERRRG